MGVKLKHFIRRFFLDCYDNLIGIRNIENFKSSVSNKLPTHEEVNIFNEYNNHKTGKHLIIEYLQSDVEILDYCLNAYVKLSMTEFGLKPLYYVSLPGYNFDCCLMSSGVTLGTLQDKQMLDDFLEVKRGGICGIMGDRYVNHSNSSIWYIDSNNLYGSAIMQKPPYKGFEYTTTPLDYVLNTPDENDHGYYTVCNVNHTNSCKDRTEQLVLMPNKRKINDNELGYRDREKNRARTEKLILDQNNKTKNMIHYRKFYVKMCVKVTKIHRVIKFK